MRPPSWMLLAGLTIATGASAVTGCGSSKTTSTGAGGAGADGSGGGGTTTSSSTTSSNSTSSSGGNCDTSGIDPTCGACLDGACCPELGACQADPECLDCISNSNADPNVCGANALYGAIDACVQASCSAECIGGGPGTPACDAPAVSPSAGACFGALDPANGKPCNPVTNEGCDAAAGEACDVNQNQDGFECYTASNTEALCDPCGNAANGNYCQGGMLCFDTCAKYCCDDGDCGTGTCDKTLLPDPNVGICLQ